MKKLTVPIFLIISLHLTANELSWVDKQIEAIKPPRKGIALKEIAQIKDPFIFLELEKEESVAKKTEKKPLPVKHIFTKRRSHHIRFSLEAIMNKSALINGKWYKEGEKVFGYLVKKVKIKSVLLTKGKKKITLTTVSKNRNLKFKNN